MLKHMINKKIGEFKRKVYTEYKLYKQSFTLIQLIKKTLKKAHVPYYIFKIIGYMYCDV